MDLLNSVINKNYRLEWNDYFISIAILTSLRSTSIKKKVGCVIVKNKRIIATGYNGFPPGVEHISILKEGKEINTIHAEQNAISQCAKMGISCENSVLYVTHYPCINCSKIIVASGISTIYYLHNNHNDQSEPVLTLANIKIIKI
ncbi:putative deoxycytidylate deaminase [Cafeteria roenbergensis virus]|uniref:Putative deoxycytidylate deaminase n=1 Tax=Cafeteria roenbergensis virus (strain BV-PW1) TaxID=693272 RepID=E3T5C5_CROVB|nr:dCMP deaminase [Cafeteria roenbergensis virus BV-PW1]ADO67388.1 putative deoxycytidylate deaminase [Cafeteria roenbergensis virus BV-PW1]